MSSMQTCLEELGVKESLLSDEQLEFLDEKGYLVLPLALDTETVTALRSRFDELVALEGDKAGIEVSQEAGSDRLANLVDKDPLFDWCWTYPPQLAAVGHVFAGRDFKLHSVNGRSAHPGHGLQALHPDWHEVVPAGDYQVCNSIWMLDCFHRGKRCDPCRARFPPMAAGAEGGDGRPTRHPHK